MHKDILDALFGIRVFQSPVDLNPFTGLDLEHAAFLGHDSQGRYIAVRSEAGIAGLDLELDCEMVGASCRRREKASDDEGDCKASHVSLLALPSSCRQRGLMANPNPGSQLRGGRSTTSRMLECSRNAPLRGQRNHGDRASSPRISLPDRFASLRIDFPEPNYTILREE